MANNPAVADVMEEIFQSILATPKRQRRLLSKTFWGKFRIERRTAERVEEIREALRQRDLILNIDDAEFGKEDKGTWLILSHVRPSPPTVGTPSQYTLWRMQLCRKSVMIRSDRIFCQYRRETQGGSVAVYYCRCKDKKRFWAEFWWKPDKDKHEWVFFDDQEGSEGYGESVANCSGCGERLHRGMLTPA